jgi:uncharacterized membrane protein YbhN (UPF0104 family)
MDLYYFYWCVVAVIIFWVFQDPNVPKYIELRLKLLRINFIKWRMARKMKKEIIRDMKTLEKWVKENGKDKM